MKRILAVVALSLASAPPLAAGPALPAAHASIAHLLSPARTDSMPADTTLGPLTLALPGFGKPSSRTSTYTLPGLGSLEVSEVNTGTGGTFDLSTEAVLK